MTKGKKINFMGLELDEWEYKSCVAHVGIGEDWATIYDVLSENEGRGHATELLKRMKEYYEKKGMRFGGSVALNPRMRGLYKKLDIKEYY